MHAGHALPKAGEGSISHKDKRLALQSLAPNEAIISSRLWHFGAGNWQLATGNWQLATGNWQLATGNWQLATGNWQLATGNW
jgi:hypothetical protein